MEEMIGLDPFAFWPERGSASVKSRQNLEIIDPLYVFHTPYVSVKDGKCVGHVKLAYNGQGDIIFRVHAIPQTKGAPVETASLKQVTLAAGKSECVIEFGWKASSTMRYALLAHQKKGSETEITHLEVSIKSPPDTAAFVAQIENVVCGAKSHDNARVGLQWTEPSLAKPTSQMCTSHQFEEAAYARWCKSLHQTPRTHRKQWEFVYILEVLEQAGMLAKGRSGVGFGVGVEPLPALMASRGVRVLATDLPATDQRAAAWHATNQHSKALSGLRQPKICDDKIFDKLVSFKEVDMNIVPTEVKDYDFTWSSCCFEHLGSIESGLSFVKKSLDCLRHGGIAVHTTELNLSSDRDTIDNQGTVLFRISDFVKLADQLAEKGHEVWPLNFNAGSNIPDKYIDTPPYAANDHLKLLLGGYVTTSFGFVVRKLAVQKTPAKPRRGMRLFGSG